MKPIVKSAFLISYSFRRVEYTIPFRYTPEKSKIRDHDRPMFILRTYKEVIDFLTKYTDFAKYYNGDYLAMKWELKEANFILDITRRKELQDAIMCDYYSTSEEDFSFENGYYPEHYINVTRLPIGVHRRLLNMDYV